MRPTLKFMLYGEEYFVVMSKTNVLLSVLHSRKLEKSGMKMKRNMS